MSNHDTEVTFEIKERVGVISTAPTGWTKEVNIVSWNGGVPKFDIREWDENHERMSRGLTLQEKEMKRLVDLVEGREKAIEAKAKLSPDHEMER